MNHVTLIGRLTADPQVSYTASQMAVAKFTLAVDRVSKDGKKDADFIRIVVFGKQAENCEKFLAKGRQTGIAGHIQTGSYKDKDGKTVYTTDVIADRVDFLEWPERNEPPKKKPIEPEEDQFGFQALNADIPF